MAPSKPKCVNVKCGETVEDRLIKCSECEEIVCVPCIHPSLKGKPNLGLIVSTLVKSDFMSLKLRCANCQNGAGEDSPGDKDDDSSLLTTKGRLDSIENSMRQMEKTLGSFVKTMTNPSSGSFSPPPSESETSSSRPTYSEIAARNAPKKICRDFKQVISDFQTEQQISQEVVISSLPEFPADDDVSTSRAIIAMSKVIGLPVTNPDFRRVGKKPLTPKGRIDKTAIPRQVIWNLGSVHRQQSILRTKKRMYEDDYFKKVYIRPALSAHKLASLPQLRESCKLMNSNENGQNSYDTWTVKYGIRNAAIRKFEKKSGDRHWGRGMDVPQNKIPSPPDST